MTDLAVPTKRRAAFNIFCSLVILLMGLLPLQHWIRFGGELAFLYRKVDVSGPRAWIVVVICICLGIYTLVGSAKQWFNATR